MLTKKFKIILILLLIIIALGLADFSQASIFAPEQKGKIQDLYGQTATAATVPRIADVTRLAVAIAQFILGFVGVIFVILIVYAGFRWMFSGGEEQKIAKAKKLITSAIMGIIIITTATAITLFISQALENASTTGTPPAASGTPAPGSGTPSSTPPCPPANDNCYACGTGVFNLCDQMECTTLGETSGGCFFDEHGNNCCNFCQRKYTGSVPYCP